MKNVLIASFDMEVGGVERSLISMLENFDYKRHNVDLMLYRQQGDFLSFIPSQVNILKEIKEYTTYRKSIREILKEGHILIGISRILAKINSDLKGKFASIEEPGYIQMQMMWKYALPFLPELKKEYEVAISYLWPHYFVAHKVKAKKKIAWIHTDYSIIETNLRLDIEMWNKFDHIIAVSDACRDSFLSKYPDLSNKVIVMENIVSKEFIKKMAEENLENSKFNDKHFNIVTVARLTHAKGVDNAVKALKILRDKGYTDICWYVVGYGGEETELRDLINKLDLTNHFILLGKKINPYPFMKHADLYVQPSRYEGKAVTVVEAQVLQRPVIITNYSTARSQVIDGINGLIVELSEEGIANGILYLHDNSNRREELSINCRRNELINKSELNKLYEIM